MNYIIIGNGESRRPINIDSIRCYKVGCNQIYRFNKVDEIVCVNESRFEISRQETDIPILTVPNLPFVDKLYRYEKELSETNIPYRGFASGPTGLEYLSTIADNGDIIYMLGFDFFYSGELVNHIYKGVSADCYPVDALPINCQNFYQQSQYIWNQYPNINYVWVGEEGNKLPVLNNLTWITVSKFLHIYEEL